MVKYFLARLLSYSMGGCAVLCLIYFPSQTEAAEKKWRGLVIAEEYRCSDYNRAADDYNYEQERKDEIIAEMGGKIYGPYTGTYFTDEPTEIEHIVATSEAHDSGLCKADEKTREAFANDLLNLTLARGTINKKKLGKDAGGWIPEFNQCWFADRVIQVKLKYNLTVDQEEANALDDILVNCTPFPMIFAQASQDAALQPATPEKKPNTFDDALERYDDNKNGRITCAEARRHGIAPVPKTHPAYRFMRDGDGDGIVCE